MNERRSSPRPGRRTVGLAAAVLVVAACGGGSGEETVAVATSTTASPIAGPTATEAPTTTRPPATTDAPTTTRTPSTSEPKPSTTTSTSTSTTTAPLPAIGSTTVFATSTTLAARETDPVPPPVDAYASEPVIEMGTISIPKIGVSMTMYEGIRMTTLDYGPGHWPGTALPGQAGNVVVGGHRTSKHKVFRNVHQLVAGDEIIFDDDNGRHLYRVNRVEIVPPTAVWIVNPTGTPTATLFACHPPGSTAQRIVVFADLVTG